MDTVRYFKSLAKAKLRYLVATSGTTAGLQKVQHQVAVDAGYPSWGALLSAHDIDRQLAVVMTENPLLNAYGIGASQFTRSIPDRRAELAEWRSELRSSADRVEMIREWLVTNIAYRQTVNPDAGSYHLKHLAEEDLQSYVTNGELIAAAIIAGYAYRSNSENAPNVDFAMSARSITAVRARVRPKATPARLLR
jgi:hypothetical protein